MDRGYFYSLLAFSFCVIIFYVVFSIVAPFLPSLGWAGVIGVLTFPVYRRLRAGVGGRDTIAAGIMTPVVVLTLVIPFVGLTFFLVQEATVAYGFLEKIAADGGKSLVESIQNHAVVRPWLNRIEAYTGPLSFEIDGRLFPEMKEVATKVFGYSKELIKNVFVFIIELILMVITLFFIYRDGENVQRHVLAIIPLTEENKKVLVDTIRRVLRAVMYGVFLTCLVQGALGGLGFWVAGLPSPILFGAIMAVCALIPVVGTGLVWLPGALYLLANGEIARGAGLIIWGVLAVSSIDNVIKPFFISGKAKLPVLVIAIGGLGGLASFGLLGAVVGPIVLALFLALFEMYRGEVETVGKGAGGGNS